MQDDRSAQQAGDPPPAGVVERMITVTDQLVVLIAAMKPHTIDAEIQRRNLAVDPFTVDRFQINRVGIVRDSVF